MSNRVTFAQILERVHRQNVVFLKNRAFAANRIAKLTSGRSRRAAFRVKDRSISRLLALGEAQVLRLYGQPIGVQFRNGGQLHLRRRTRPTAARHGARNSSRLLTVQEGITGGTS